MRPPPTPSFPLPSPGCQVLASEGVTRYDPMGEPFDPNLHAALFEVPDATKDAGTVAVVIKVRGASSAGMGGGLS